MRRPGVANPGPRERGSRGPGLATLDLVIMNDHYMATIVY